MTSSQIELVKTSWARVATMDAVAVGGLFYGRLFEIAPELRPLFKNPLGPQSQKLIAMIGYVINKLDKLEDIVGEVGKLAVRHTSYGVKDEHYTLVGKALLWTLEQGLGAAWNEELKTAWTACYTLLAEAMMDASRANSQAA